MRAAARTYAWEGAEEHFEATLAAMQSRGAEPLAVARFIAGGLTMAQVFDNANPRTRELSAIAAEAFASAGAEVRAARMTLAHARTYQTSNKREAIDFTRATALITGAMEVAKRHNDVSLLSECSGTLTNIRFQTGDCAGADVLACQLTALDSAALQGWGHTLHGFYASHLGLVSEGARSFQSAWDLTHRSYPEISGTLSFWHYRTNLFRLRAPALATTLLTPLRNLKVESTVMDSNHRAMELAVSREQGHALGEGVAMWPDDLSEGLIHDETRELLQLVAFRNGEWEEPLAFFRRHREATEACGAVQLVGMLSAVMADLARTAGLHAEAEELLGCTVALKTPLDRVTAHAGLAILYAETGRYAEIVEQAVACRALMNGDDWLGLGARVEFVEALALLVKGERDAAVRTLERAIATMRRVENPWDEPDARFVFGQVLAARGMAREAVGQLDEALAVLRRIEAGQAFVDRVLSVWPGGASRPLSRRSAAHGASAIRERPPAGLSKRELEVLTLVARGRSNREIASALFVAEPTVATHVRHILEKTGTANRTEAALFAVRLKLVQADHPIG